ncbi:MAG: cyclic nucleotide-binding domain-containing protein [bacterium]|nr:cyclic nucleotide-binding domain-containing protein [bacterium]
MIKKMFGRRKKRLTDPDDRELTIEDLITLERYEEAEEKLKVRLKLVPKDLHAHLRLAEVYLALKNVVKALDEFQFVADSQADDGFFDKAIAVLSKAIKLAPGDENLPKRIERYRRMKRLEKRRQLAVEGLLGNKTTRAQTAGNQKLEIELLWNKIAKSHLVEQLSAVNLKKLFSVMKMMRARPDKALAEAGSNVPVMFMVVDGVVEAGAEVNGRYTSIRAFSTGDLIGESALLERKSWPARYVVTESATLFQLDRQGLEEVMQGNEDPLAFLSALRQQANDRDVAASLQRLHIS